MTQLNVGPTGEAIAEARTTILAILDADRSDQVTIAAFEALTKVASVPVAGDITISGNTLTAGSSSVPGGVL